MFLDSEQAMVAQIGGLTLSPCCCFRGQSSTRFRVPKQNCLFFELSLYLRIFQGHVGSHLSVVHDFGIGFEDPGTCWGCYSWVSWMLSGGDACHWCCRSFWLEREIVQLGKEQALSWRWKHDFLICVWFFQPRRFVWLIWAWCGNGITSFGVQLLSLASVAVVLWPRAMRWQSGWIEKWTFLHPNALPRWDQRGEPAFRIIYSEGIAKHCFGWWKSYYPMWAPGQLGLWWGELFRKLDQRKGDVFWGVCFEVMYSLSNPSWGVVSIFSGW